MEIQKLFLKLNLIKIFKTRLNVDKKHFIKELDILIDKGYYSPVLAVFDIFSPNSKKYIGDINDNELKIRERYDFENFRGIKNSKLKAKYHIDNDNLNIETTIQGMSIIAFILRCFILIIYSLMMLLLIIEAIMPPINFDIAYVYPPIFVSFIVFILTYLPYLNARKSVRNMKTDIERIYEQIEKNTLQHGL